MPLTDEQQVVQNKPNLALRPVLEAKGIVECLPSFEYVPSKSVTPKSGRGYLYALDDARAVDGDGERKSWDRVKNFADDPHYEFVDPDTDKRFWPGAGALVQMRDVTLEPGEAFVFDWMMITPVGVGENIAVFMPCPDGQPAPELTHDSVSIVWARNQKDYSSPHFEPAWKPVRWADPAGFKGTMRWLVMSGETRNDGQHPSRAKFAWPATLLIDGIDIVPSDGNNG
jgi:hypothetical protein